MKYLTQRTLLGSLLLAAAANVSALPSGLSNITISDGDYTSGTWYGNYEDQEVEPGMAGNQVWDLEGFYSYGTNQLAAVGGFDFKNGVAGYQGAGNQLDFRSGDIFIDIDNNHIAGNAVANDGNGQSVVTNTFGYDFVLDVNWAAGTYDVVSLDADSQTKLAYYDANYGSSPWLYVGGGNYVESGSFSYESGLSDAASGMTGGTHYGVYGFDLSFLGNADFYSHLTMGCGNDNLMGHGRTTEVPAPGALALLAVGLFGLARARKQVAAK